MVLFQGGSALQSALFEGMAPAMRLCATSVRDLTACLEWVLGRAESQVLLFQS